MLNALIVGAGGFFGSALRFLIGVGVGKFFSASHVPVATLLVNVLGSFAIGILASIVTMKGDSYEMVRLFLVVGFLGGFTTFSTFSHETVQLFKGSYLMWGMCNIMLNVGLCLIAAASGAALVKLAQ